MATIKYIGRTTDFCGKSLWEIVGNLKNFGIGRVVKRQMFERYQEPSYLRILKVEAVPHEVSYLLCKLSSFINPIVISILGKPKS